MLAEGLLVLAVILLALTMCAYRTGERPIVTVTLAAACWGVIVAACLAALVELAQP